MQVSMSDNYFFLNQLVAYYRKEAFEMSLTLPYSGSHADGCYDVSIATDCTVTIDDQTVKPGEKSIYTAQLINVHECEQLLAELDSQDDGIIYEDNSVVNKYPTLHPVRP